SHDGRSIKATRKTKSTKEQKMKSLKFFKPALATPHYLFVALLFASFAVASVSAANPQRRIVFAYTTDPILCCFNEQVALHGTILISFKSFVIKPTLFLLDTRCVSLRGQFSGWTDLRSVCVEPDGAWLVIKRPKTEAEYHGIPSAATMRL